MQFRPPSQPGWSSSEVEQPQQEFPQQQTSQPFFQQLQPPTQPAWQEPQYPPPPETYYPPQLPLTPAPPPKKRMRPNDKLAWSVIGSLIVIVALIFIGVVANGNTTAQSNQNATATAQALNASDGLTATALANENATVIAAGNTSLSNDLTQTAMTPTAQPTTPPQTGIGSLQSSGVWSITINSVSPTNGGEFDNPPHAGNRYILVNFTAHNTDTSAHDMSPVYFTVRDDQGNTYGLAYITVPHDPRGTVIPGQQLRGDLSYELPKTLHSFTLQFDAPEDFDNSQVVQWQLSV